MVLSVEVVKKIFNFVVGICVVLMGTYKIVLGSEVSEYLIPVPSGCHYIQAVHDHRVYLSRREGVCTQAIKFLKIKVRPHKDGYVEIYDEGRLWLRLKTGRHPEDLAEYTYSLAETLYNSTKFNLNGSLEFQIKDEKVLIEAWERAKKTYELTQSEEFISKVEDFKKQLQGVFDFDNATLESFYTNLSTKDTKRSNLVLRLSEDERVYVFVSSSLPKETIRSFVKQASLIGGKVYFVLRGGLGGLTRVTPTVEWVYDVIIKDKSCNFLKEKCEVYPVEFLIDPFLFRRYKIDKVPAVVFVKGVRTDFERSEGLPEVKIDKAWVSLGDVSLFRHLRKIGLIAGIEKLSRIEEWK